MTADRTATPLEPARSEAAAAWLEWKARCALGRCEPGTARRLTAFAASRLSGLLIRVARAAGVPPPPAPPDADAWHLFESHLVIKGEVGGRACKDWLFARAAPGGRFSLDALQVSATLLFRDAVREHLRRERAPAFQVSLSAPLTVGEAGSALTLEDLLPGASDPSEEADRRELETLAEAAADDLWSATSRRLRVGWLARALRLALYHPDVLAAARCGKSALHAELQAAQRNLVGELRRRHPREEASALYELSVRTAAGLLARARTWGRTEETCARLFLMAGDEPT